MQAAINTCISDDPSARLTFEQLQGEIFHHLIAELCYEATQAADCEAVGLIEKYGTHQLLYYQEIIGKWCCIHRACTDGRLEMVKALVAKGADPNSKNGFGETPLDFAVGWNRQSTGEYLYSQGGRCRKQTYPSSWKK